MTDHWQTLDNAPHEGSFSGLVVPRGTNKAVVVLCWRNKHNQFVCRTSSGDSIAVNTEIVGWRPGWIDDGEHQLYPT
jgi:hypothetical protein